MNFLILKQQIIEILGDSLGKYTLANGQIVSAIAVGNNYPPQGTKVTGLEVVIIPDTGLEVNPIMNGGRWDNESTVILKQWGEGTVLDAVKLIVPLLGNQVEIGARVLPNESLGNIETIRIKFNSTMLERWGF
jgi:hypothetical protein